MSADVGGALLLDAADVEEIERDLKRIGSVASAVLVNPTVTAEPKRGRKKRISIPADDVQPAQAPPVETSWVAMLYPVDTDALVDEAFSPERLSRVPAACVDDDIVDIELDEVPSVERQAATSGEIVITDVLPPAKATPQAAEPQEARDVAVAPPPMPTDAGLPPPSPQDVSRPPPVPSSPPQDVSRPPPVPPPTPPPSPQDVSGPPPVPLSAFTEEIEQVEQVEQVDEPAAAGSQGAGVPPPVPDDVIEQVSEEDAEEEVFEEAVAPPPVPDDVIEQVSEEDADEEVFEGEEITSVDEVKPLEFPDQGTPPPIPPEVVAALLVSDSAAAGQGVQAEAGAAPAETDAPPPTPPEIPSDAKGAGQPQPAAGPPAVPAGPPTVPRKKRPKKFKKPWFEEFFDDDYLRTIPFMTPTYTVKEMEYIRSHLGLPDGARLLDVGCGYGRLAIEFARAGFDVTGLDTSLPLMFLAAEAAIEAGVEVNFMHQDMREMSFDNEFDGIYCVTTSFGYFDDETNRDVVSRMHRAVKPGGKLFIEVINRDFILGDLPSRGWWEGDDCVIMDEVEFNFLTSRIVSKRSVVFSDGRSVNHDLSIRAYCLHELGRMLHNAGFRVVSVTGNINTDSRFFGMHSPFLIVLSEKHK